MAAFTAIPQYAFRFPFAGTHLQGKIFFCDKRLHSSSPKELQNEFSAFSNFSFGKIRLSVAFLLRMFILREERTLREVDLREADLREADLREADLREADLREADLREAERGLRETDLRKDDRFPINAGW